MQSPRQVLADSIDLDGADVLDVGCGEGELVRWMRSLGARAVGAECGGEMLARAHAADPDHADGYVDAAGEDLPFPDGTFDAVVFSASLHHVPVEEIPTALAEARRVLRPGGTLFVSEPAVEPPDRDLFRPVVDEQEVRAAAQAALDGAVGPGGAFDLVRRFEHEYEMVVDDLDAMLDRLGAIDPDRRELLEWHRDELRARIERLGERRPDGWAFRRRNLVAVLRAD